MVNEFRKKGEKTEKRGENGKKGLIGRFSEKSEKCAGFGKDGSRGLEKDAEGTYFCLKFFYHIIHILNFKNYGSAKGRYQIGRYFGRPHFLQD
ncbi:MAG: hypothetical protein CRN43_13585 [Candidatus Nephrothrix sp. EaCA]|nr:MAG: hypothetical protein CRN43_13585 [Candidatus Nephrothrix sp. EaCA]